MCIIVSLFAALCGQTGHMEELFMLWTSSWLSHCEWAVERSLYRLESPAFPFPVDWGYLISISKDQ